MTITPDARWVVPVIPGAVASQLAAVMAEGASVLVGNGVTPAADVYRLLDLLSAAARAYERSGSDGCGDTPHQVPTKVPMISAVPSSPHADWITAEAVRERLRPGCPRVSSSFVTRLARDHVLVAVKVRGQWRFDPASVDEYRGRTPRRRR